MGRDHPRPERGLLVRSITREGKLGIEGRNPPPRAAGYKPALRNAVSSRTSHKDRGSALRRSMPHSSALTSLATAQDENRWRNTP